MRAHDPPDALLVDTARRGRRQVHADRRARRVPALGQQHRVDQDVDLAALVGSQRLGEPDGRRSARDGLRLEPDGAELLGQVVRVVDARGIDDAGCVVETLAIKRCGSLVQRLMIERLGQDLLVEVAADDRHLVDRRNRRDAQVAQRGDQPPARGILQRQIVDGRGEDVGDLFRDELLRRRHADVQRLRERADRGACLLAERRMRLVADHELVDVARDRLLGGARTRHTSGSSRGSCRAAAPGRSRSPARSGRRTPRP